MNYKLRHETTKDYRPNINLKCYMHRTGYGGPLNLSLITLPSLSQVMTALYCFFCVFTHSVRIIFFKFHWVTFLYCSVDKSCKC